MKAVIRYITSLIIVSIWLAFLIIINLDKNIDVNITKGNSGPYRVFANKSCIVESWVYIDPTADTLKRHLFCDDVAENSDILCRWYLDQKNITNHKECLIPQDNYKVPSIVFYIIFGYYPFTFIHYMCILSAHKIQNPRTIYVIGDKEPLSKWWKKLKEDIPNLRFIYRKKPETIFGLHILWTAHASDIVRLQILIANGGIYMDVDEIFVNNFNPLRNFSTTMGIIDKFTGMGNAVIVAKRRSPFLKELYENYRTYNNTDYFKSSLKSSYRLMEKNRKAVHLESMKLYRPLWSQTDLLYNQTGYKWRNKYAIHLWSKQMGKYHGKIPNKLSDMDKLNTTLGEVLRNVYYNDSRVRSAYGKGTSLH